jgi:hypothetical protein
MRLSWFGFFLVLIYTGIFLAVLVAPVMGVMGSAMFNTDLFGPNIASKDVVPGNDGKIECVLWCENTPGCVGATWVAPGIQGTSARCWIKSEVSQILPNKDCCISWTTQAAAVQSYQYSVEITSNPEGREFIVDSETRGTTPVTITLERGNHKILFPGSETKYCFCSEYTETFFVSEPTKLTFQLPLCYCYSQSPHLKVKNAVEMPPTVPFIALAIIVLFMVYNKRRDS